MRLVSVIGLLRLYVILITNTRTNAFTTITSSHRLHTISNSIISGGWFDGRWIDYYSPLRQQKQQCGFASLLSAKKSKQSSNGSSSNSNLSKDDTKKGPKPVTLLSGFLGTGKTSTLQHLLQNKENLKIGVIVNDVASVNIDAKLISNDSRNNNNQEEESGVANSDAFIDLQNGCVCCSLSDELFLSVNDLVTKRPDLDHIVIELSGVADPVSMKNNWNMAPTFIKNEVASLQNVVTLVDATSFGTDYMTWDTTQDRPQWLYGSDGTNNRKVAELLAEQVEAADLILLNKCDIADTQQITVATAVARALNEKAEIQKVEFGKISPSRILEARMKQDNQNEEDDDGQDHNHSHSHDHDSKATEGIDCTAPDCTDTSHSHEHSSSEKHEETVDCTTPGCTDSSHSHSHEHTADCEHDHDHHGHSHSHETSVDNLGIVNFVYKAARPFNPARLMKVLNKWPVSVHDKLDVEVLKDASKEGYNIKGKSSTSISPFIGVIRSKGFCWFAPYHWYGPGEDSWRHDTAMYWSHAGRQLGISVAGKWWGTLPEEKMKKYFINSNMAEYERIKREDFVTDEFQDRRQELVFIGISLDETKIRKTLDDCLLNDEEMEEYRQQVSRLNALIQN